LTVAFEKRFPDSAHAGENWELLVGAVCDLAGITVSEPDKLPADDPAQSTRRFFDPAREMRDESIRRGDLPADLMYQLFDSRFGSYRADLWYDHETTRTLARMEAEAEAFGKRFPGYGGDGRLLIRAGQIAEQFDDVEAAKRLYVKAAACGDADTRRRAGGIMRQMELRGRKLSLVFTTYDGRLFDLEQMRGKVVLLVGWATWCPGCVNRLKSVKALHEKYRDRGFEVVAINFDEDRDKMEQVVGDHDLPWPHHFDGAGRDNAVGRELGI
jgi:hypothetical protein